MPFKFGIRKARRYNVSSRNAYVICVNMLDNMLIECTLTADGTGHDCLQNIAQRIHINEIYYFGLQYVNKKLQFRWLDLDKPLKKQLDKSGHSPLLYFRVMFYVADVDTIRDDNTRYQYYLQLRHNVLECKLPCDQKQATLLGAYSLQAEFGDHDPHKHTVEQLHDYLYLPRNMCTEERTMLRLTQEMLELHRNLSGLPPSAAEAHYIREAQQLEGYGLDYYPAKDNSGQEILLGASFIGIFVKYSNGQPANYFKWSDINNLTSSKKNFNIETSLSEKTVHFQMDDPEMVKYVFKMCSLQHKFYHTRQHSVPLPKETIPSMTVHSDSNANKVGSIGPVPDIQQSVQLYDNTHENVQEYTNVEITEENHYENRDVKENHYENRDAKENHYENRDAMLEHEQQQQQQQQQEPISLDLVEQQQQQEPQQSSLPTRVPSYRPAPDYETIMQQRMEYMAVQQQQEKTLHLPNIGRAQVYGHPELLAYSQPEISMHPPQMMLPYNLHHSHHVTQGHIYSEGITVDRTNSLIIQPTYSTPELYKMSTAPQRPEHHLSPIHMYKLPPPYPRSSSSFPDLASTQSGQHIHDSSPDLVSRKNLNNAGLILQSQLDQSMENLALDISAQQYAAQQQQQQQIGDMQYSSQQQQHSEVHYQAQQQHSDLQYQAQHQQQQHSDLHFQAHQQQQHSDLQYQSQTHAETYPSEMSNPEEEKEVFIMDPPNPSAQPQFVIQQQYVKKHYGSENPYENLPPAYCNPDPLDVTVDVQEDSSIASHHTSDSTVSDQASSTPSMGNNLQKLSGLNGSLLEISASETRAPKDDRRKLLETKLEEGQVFQEFELVPKKRTKSVCNVGERDDNKKRNRFKDILPYDDTRVVLNQSKKNPSGYINASHIKMSINNRELRYIAAQGPLEHTIEEFWQMVWEQKIQVIAMLTGLEEGTRQKCHRYWPEERGPKNKKKYGEYEVYVKLCQNSGSYITRTLSVLHCRTKKQRVIWHLQYTGWPDHGCPDDTLGFQCYLEEIESVRRQAEMELGPDIIMPATLVHCSAGVGRTGVVILTHIMRICLDMNKDAQIPSVLEKLRSQRMHMVQTVTQYTFVYNCLVDYLKGARLI